MNSEPGLVTNRSKEAELSRATPAQVFELYIQRYNSNSVNTIQTKRSTWKQFTHWFEEVHGGTWLSELGPAFAVHFQDWLRTCPEIEQKEISIKSNIKRLKSIIEFAQSRQYVHPDIPSTWDIPNVDRADEIRDDPLESERGVEIMRYLEEKNPYSADHVLWILLFRYGLRISAIRAIDRDDVIFDPSDGRRPHIVLRDRPELGGASDEGLPLKNTSKKYGARLLPLRDDVAEILWGYIKYDRKWGDEVDNFGLCGLLTTERSTRISKHCINTWSHALTSPVAYKGRCDCSGCQHYHQVNEKYPPRNKRRKVCELTHSPHQVRHGAITHMLRQGNSWDLIAHLVGTRPQELRATYDRRNQWHRLNDAHDGWVCNPSSKGPPLREADDD